MKVEKITVRAGRTVPHPLHQFGNLKADLEIVASLDDGDDPEQVRRDLQARIESDIEQHVADLKDGIRDLQAMANTRKRVALLESELAEKTAELETLRQQADEHDALPLFQK